MSNKEKYDWTAFNDPEGGLSIFAHGIRRSMSYDSYAGTNTFKARALTDMFPLTANQLMAIDGGVTNTESGNNTRYAFKARILGANSPHSFLPNVCDPSYSGDQESTYKVISMHTTYISTDVYLGQGVTRGDIITVEMTKSGQTYNMEYGRFIELSSIENPVDTANTECFSLVGLVGAWSPNIGEDLAGATDTSPTLHKNSRPSSDQTLDELEGIVLVNDLDKPLGRSESKLDPVGIILHSTVSATGDSTIRTLGKRGLSYHFVVEKDGTIRQLAKIEKQAWHDPGSNSSMIGIALTNLSYDIDHAEDPSTWIDGPKTDGSIAKWDPILAVQMTAMKSLIAALRKKYPGIVKIRPHSGTAGGKSSTKQDPGPLVPKSIYIG
jgi:N-acetyl-anhydromuramyl-L-alanine amidase AmpD